jgi:YVTN family beta-propeller protein
MRGHVTISSGYAYGTGSAGDLSLTAGSNFGSGNGGSIILLPGEAPSGDPGHIRIASSFGDGPSELRFMEDNFSGSDFVSFRAPVNVSSSTVWTLPTADGTSGQVLSTDGAGNLSFINAGSGGGGDSHWTYSTSTDTYLTTTSTGNVAIGGRLDAPYLNRWFTSPLLTQTVYKGGRANVPVGSAPHGVAFDGSHIWVANYNDSAANSLSKIDPLTNTVIATTTLPGSANNADGMAFDGTYLWVAAEDGSDGYLHKVNVITNQVDASVALSTTFRFPQSVTFDGTYIWVTQTGSFPSSSIVTQVNPNTNTIVAEIPVGVSPYGVAFDGEYIWVANLDSATVNKISPTTSSVVATTTGVLNANGVVFDGSFIWVSSAFSDLVYKINPATAAVVDTVSLDSGVNAQHMAFDGTYIWVAQQATTTISKFDPRTSTVVQRISMPGAARSIAVDGSHVWVTNSLFSDYVTKIPYGVSEGSSLASSGGSETLLTVSNRGAIATSTLTLYRGFVAASSSVTGTLNVVGGLTFTGATGTTFAISRGTLGNSTATNMFVNTTLGFLNATGTTFNTNILSAATGTISNFNFLNATGTYFSAATGTFGAVTTSNLWVGGQLVCLANGVNCPVAASSDTLLTVSNRGGDCYLYVVLVRRIYRWFLDRNIHIERYWSVECGYSDDWLLELQ